MGKSSQSGFDYIGRKRERQPYPISTNAAIRGTVVVSEAFVLRQSWFDGLGAMGGLPALAASGADKLPLTPVNSDLTKH